MKYEVVTVSDADRQFHETWRGMVQPSEGLVLSIPEPPKPAKGAASKRGHKPPSSQGTLL